MGARSTAVYVAPTACQYLCSVHAAFTYVGRLGSHLYTEKSGAFCGSQHALGDGYQADCDN